MAPRPRRNFTAEFKAETVVLVRSSGTSIRQVCRDLDLTETAVRRWVEQAEIDAGKRPGLTTDERAELAQLRRENRVLREEREILKKRRPSSRVCQSGCGLAGLLAFSLPGSVPRLLPDSPLARSAGAFGVA
jgi:transposase